jgi:hypothetical protein
MTAAVNYRTYTQYDHDAMCCICLDNLRDGAEEVAGFDNVQNDVVAHNDGGEHHPIHRICLLRNFEQHQNCPDCRKEINEVPLNPSSFKGKVVTAIRNAALKVNDAAEYVAMIVSAFFQGVKEGFRDLYDGFKYLLTREPALLVGVTTVVISIINTLIRSRRAQSENERRSPEEVVVRRLVIREALTERSAQRAIAAANALTFSTGRDPVEGQRLLAELVSAFDTGGNPTPRAARRVVRALRDIGENDLANIFAPFVAGIV